MNKQKQWCWGWPWPLLCCHTESSQGTCTCLGVLPCSEIHSAQPRQPLTQIQSDLREHVAEGNLARSPGFFDSVTFGAAASELLRPWLLWGGQGRAAGSGSHGPLPQHPSGWVCWRELKWDLGG